MTAPGDPIVELSHDHGHLGALVLAVRSTLARIERAEVTFEDGVEDLDEAVLALRDALLAHFAREEEGFFPFVESHVAAMRARVETLRSDHDFVCQRVDALSLAVHRGTRDGVGYALCVRSFDRFEEVYARHAQAERALLGEIDANLDGAARELLRAILAEI